MLKDQLFKISRLQFDDWLLGPEKFSGLSRNGPLGPSDIKKLTKMAAGSLFVHSSGEGRSLC